MYEGFVLFSYWTVSLIRITAGLSIRAEHHNSFIEDGWWTLLQKMYKNFVQQVRPIFMLFNGDSERFAEVERLTHPFRGSQTGCLLHMSLSILRTITQDLSPFTRAWVRQRERERERREEQIERGREGANECRQSTSAWVTNKQLSLTVHESENSELKIVYVFLLLFESDCIVKLSLKLCSIFFISKSKGWTGEETDGEGRGGEIQGRHRHT